MKPLKIAKIPTTAPMRAFVISKETIKELDYGDCPGIAKAIDSSNTGRFMLDCEEIGHFGAEAHEGDVVRYEEHNSLSCPAGWNMWIYGLPTIIKSNTEIYKVQNGLELRDAIFFDNIKDAQAFVEENCSREYVSERVTIANNKISIKTDWGLSEGKLGECFIVKYQRDDFNILTIGTKTVDEYYIFDDEGNIKKALKDY